MTLGELDLGNLESKASTSHRLIIQIGVLEFAKGCYEKKNDAKSLKKARTIKKSLDRMNQAYSKGIVTPLSDEEIHKILYEK